MLKYLELKSGQNDQGPAWIARVKLSKSGRTVYFNGKALKRADGKGISANYFDLETGEEYWVSGVKKNGQDRHWAGAGIVWIESGVVAEYLKIIGADKIDECRLKVIADLPQTEVEKFRNLENTRLT